MKAINYHVKLATVHDQELFANAIKDALTRRVSNERFSLIRLTGAPMRVNDFMHHGLRGQTSAGGAMEVAQRDNALQLAGTVIHEMAHVLVGTQQEHNYNWVSAATHLGMNVVEAEGQRYAPEHFDADALRIIEEAIERFAVENPTLVYDPNMVIPWPPGVGTYECPDFDSLTGNKCKTHKIHILKFQIEGIREMLARSGNILLADDPGLGKTIQAIGYINATHPQRVLVICPNSVKLVWEQHFHDYCIHKDYDVQVQYSQLYTYDDQSIMNYEALAKWVKQLKVEDWDLIIADEAHYAKTPSSQRARALFAMKAKKVIFITGTPIVNYPLEVFPLMHYLCPDQSPWDNVMTFQRWFGTKTGDQRFGRNLNRLNTLLRDHAMTRRLKKDVMSELPRKRRNVVEFEVSDEVRKLIETEKKLYAQLTDAGGVAFLNAMRNDSEEVDNDTDWQALIEGLKYTRRVAFEEMARVAHLIGLAKLPLAIDYIENALENREKVVVFGHHRDVLERVYERFSPGAVLLLGGNRDQSLATAQAAERFNNDDSCTVFVGQISIAQGYSIKGSSTVIFIEEDWVPGIMTQAEDRCHGIGRGDSEAKSMLIHHLVFKDSLDTYKAKLTIRKQKSIDRAVGAIR